MERSRKKNRSLDALATALLAGEAIQLLETSLHEASEGSSTSTILHKSAYQTNLASALFVQKLEPLETVIDLQRAGTSTLQKCYGKKVPCVMAEMMRLADFLEAHGDDEEASRIKKEVGEVLSDRPAIRPKFEHLLKRARGQMGIRGT